MSQYTRFALLAAICGLVWAVPRAASGAPEVDPLLAAVPPQATGAALVDLRADTEDLKAVAAAHTPEQRAALRAGLLLGLQVALGRLAPGMDLEKDVLPWLTRRAALCWLTVAERKQPDTLFLIETPGGTLAAAGFEQLVQAALKGERATAAPAVDGVPVWKISAGKDGLYAANLGTAIAVSTSEAAVGQAVRQAGAAAGGAALAPAAQAVSGMPPGLFRAAMNPEGIQADPNGPGKTLGVAGFGGALRFTPAGLMLDVAIPTADDKGPWAALAQMKPTFAESIAGIPENAVAALVAARPSLWVHATNIPLFDALAGGFVGPPPVKALGPGLGPLLNELLGQEVAIGILPADKQVTWLAVFTSGRPNDLPGLVQRLTQMGGGVEGVAWAQAPLGQAPGWVLRLSLRPGQPPTEIHLALLGPRLLVGGSRAALEAGAATLAGKGKPVAGAAWLEPNAELLGPNPLLKAGVDVRAVGPIVAAMVAGKAGVPAPYIARLMNTLLVACTGLSAGIRMEGGTVRATTAVGIDYPKLAAMGGLTLPAAAAAAAGAASDAKGKQPPQKPAEAKP